VFRSKTSDEKIKYPIFFINQIGCLSDEKVMSMISRYKRPGGFIQILSLIESSSPSKRDKFLEIIRSESLPWAEAIEQRMISLDKIFSWPDEVVVEIFKGLPLRNMACALQGFSEEQRTRIFNYMSHSEKRKVEDEMGAMKSNPEEFNGTLLKVLEITRKMITDGRIRLDKIDPDLVIPEDFEENLGKNSTPAAFSQKSSESHIEAEKVQEAVHNAQKSGAGGSAELLQLQRVAQALTTENRSLRDEVKVLKSKLEQIRKIA